MSVASVAVVCATIGAAIWIALEVLVRRYL